MTPRRLAVAVALFIAVRILTARITLLPGVAVPAVIPLGAVALAVVVTGVWLIRRRARRFRSCPHPHAVWGAP